MPNPFFEALGKRPAPKAPDAQPKAQQPDAAGSRRIADPSTTPSLSSVAPDRGRGSIITPKRVVATTAVAAGSIGATLLLSSCFGPDGTPYPDLPQNNGNNNNGENGANASPTASATVAPKNECVTSASGFQSCELNGEKYNAPILTFTVNGEQYTVAPTIVTDPKTNEQVIGYANPTDNPFGFKDTHELLGEFTPNVTTNGKETGGLRLQAQVIADMLNTARANNPGKLQDIIIFDPGTNSVTITDMPNGNAYDKTAFVMMNVSGDATVVNPYMNTTRVDILAAGQTGDDMLSGAAPRTLPCMEAICGSPENYVKVATRTGIHDAQGNRIAQNTTINNVQFAHSIGYYVNGDIVMSDGTQNLSYQQNPFTTANLLNVDGVPVFPLAS